jgi:hypothetical protein
MIPRITTRRKGLKTIASRYHYETLNISQPTRRSWHIVANFAAWRSPQTTRGCACRGASPGATPCLAYSAGGCRRLSISRLRPAGFMRMGEFAYSAAMASNKGTRPRILRRSDINFAADSNTATLLLQRSKTDINRTGVRIILAATGDAACPVTALRRLFDTDSKVDPDEPLFSFSGKNTAFTRTRVLSRMTIGLRKAGIQNVGFSDHSFRRGAAQHATDMGMLAHEIQLLGRWTSAAFLLYFSHSPSRIRALNHQFQTGVAPTL